MSEIVKADGIAQPILTVSALKKTYKDGTVALRGVDFTVKAGEIVGIIGSSGAGKSTLMRCINRLIEPSDGYVYFDGIDVTKSNKHQLRYVRRQMGMIFQSFNLIARSTVLGNVLNGRLGYMDSVRGALGIFSKQDIEDAMSILERVGLVNQAHKRADELSGGQQQRVGIARALAQNPKLILADEPIASLDPVTSENIMDYIYRICKEDGITCLINLHQVEFAKRYADRIIGIRAGRRVFEGRAQDLAQDVVQEIYA